MCVIANRWGSFFGILHTRESKPHTGDPRNGMLHFLYVFILTTTDMNTNIESSYIISTEDGFRIEIPTAISAIEECRFLGTDIETIIIPENIKAIGRGAFMGSRVKKIVFPDSLTEIAEDAFCACVNLEKIYLPARLTAIGARAFMGCDSLTTVVFPPALKSLGNEAFAFCHELDSVKLPKTIKKVGKNVFLGCPIENDVSYSCTYTRGTRCEMRVISS